MSPQLKEIAGDGEGHGREALVGPINSFPRLFKPVEFWLNGVRLGKLETKASGTVVWYDYHTELILWRKLEDGRTVRTPRLVRRHNRVVMTISMSPDGHVSLRMHKGVSFEEPKELPWGGDFNATLDLCEEPSSHPMVKTLKRSPLSDDGEEMGLIIDLAGHRSEATSNRTAQAVPCEPSLVQAPRRRELSLLGLPDRAASAIWNALHHGDPRPLAAVAVAVGVVAGIAIATFMG